MVPLTQNFQFGTWVTLETHCTIDENNEKYMEKSIVWRNIASYHSWLKKRKIIPFQRFTKSPLNATHFDLKCQWYFQYWWGNSKRSVYARPQKRNRSLGEMLGRQHVIAQQKKSAITRCGPSCFAQWVISLLEPNIYPWQPSGGGLGVNP